MFWVAVRSFAGTIALFTTLGLLMAGGTFYLLKENPFFAYLSAALIILESAMAGTLLGAKRALVLALANGVSRLQLGRSTLRICFDQLLDVPPEGSFGSRGTQVAVAAERVPLAQAEERLGKVITKMTGNPPPDEYGQTPWTSDFEILRKTFAFNNTPLTYYNG